MSFLLRQRLGLSGLSMFNSQTVLWIQILLCHPDMHGLIIWSVCSPQPMALLSGHASALSTIQRTSLSLWLYHLDMHGLHHLATVQTSAHGPSSGHKIYVQEWRRQSDHSEASYALSQNSCFSSDWNECAALPKQTPL